MKLISLLAIVICFTSATNPVSQKNFSAQDGFAVVELFTSEGCSSCPPADEAVIAVAKEYPKNVYILGFHVDYWDALGWKDAFSNSGYTQRQREYAATFNLNSIYTPEIVVNGKTEFVGSDRDQLHKAIDQALQSDNTSKIELNASSDAQTVHINYKTSADHDHMLNVAVVQLQTQTAVKRGENAGRQLHHINIVRDFKSISQPGEQGSISLHLPTGLTAKDCAVIAYTQDKKNLHITGATKTEILNSR